MSRTSVSTGLDGVVSGNLALLLELHGVDDEMI
jgi:hypothetical protein